MERKKRKYVLIFMVLISISIIYLLVKTNLNSAKPIEIKAAENNHHYIKTTLLKHFEDISKYYERNDFNSLRVFFHPLQWKALKADYGNLSNDQLIESLESSLPSDINVKLTFLNIADSIINQNKLAYLINYQIELSRSDGLLGTHLQQLLLNSNDAGSTWKYFQIFTTDCEKTKNYLLEYYSELELNKISEHLCNPSYFEERDTSIINQLFIPSSNEENDLLENFENFNKAEASGDISYYPEALFEVLSENTGEEYSITDIKEYVQNSILESIESLGDVERKRLINNILFTHKNEHQNIYLINCLETFSRNNNSLDNLTIKNNLICIYYNSSNKWSFFSVNDNSEFIERILNKLFSSTLKNEILNALPED
jgi:hypothetical protein